MYRCFYFVLLLVFLHSKDGNAQVGGLGMERMDSSTIEIGSGIPLNILNRSFEKDVLLGSEYSNEDFVNATVNGTSQAYKLRYNNYLDVFEYEIVVNNIIYISKEQYKEVRYEDLVNATVNGSSQAFKLRYNNYLDVLEYENVVNNIIYISKEQYKEVHFHDSSSYVLKEYPSKKETKEGYLLAAGNENSKIRIYTTQLMEYKASKMAQNSYEKSSQPEYKLKKSTFFIEYNDKLIPFNKGKDLTKAFPEHKKDIKAFFKQNNISLDSPDIIKLQNFLTSIL